MRFLPLDELLKERSDLIRSIAADEKHKGLLVEGGVMSAEEEEWLHELQRERLRDIEIEIAERTSKPVE